MMEILQWVSLVMLWFALGVNVYCIWRNDRLNKELKRQLKIWGARNGYLEKEDAQESND